MALALDTPNTNLGGPPSADSPTANLASLIGGQQQPQQSDRKQSVQKAISELQMTAQQLSRMEPGLAPIMRKVIELTMQANTDFVGNLREPESSGEQYLPT